MSYAIVPVAAVADTVATSAVLLRTIAVADEVPEKVCVPVKVLATLTTGILAPAKVVAPVPPEAMAKVADKPAAVVAVDALPVSAAVIVPAEKLPEASRATIADAVFKLVAVVFALVTLKVPPKVKLPVVVTVPVRVNPLTVPVPPTLVTVPPVPVALIVWLGQVPVIVTPVP